MLVETLYRKRGDTAIEDTITIQEQVKDYRDEPPPRGQEEESKSTGGGSTDPLCSLGMSHSFRRNLTELLVERHRTLVGVEDFWKIISSVLCPHEMVGLEASLEYDDQAWFARLVTRCNLPLDHLEWLVVHELRELFRYRSTSIVFHSLSFIGTSSPKSVAVASILEKQYRYARNQEIEIEVRQYLGIERPDHLSYPSFLTTKEEPDGK